MPWFSPLVKFIPNAVPLPPILVLALPPRLVVLLTVVVVALTNYVVEPSLRKRFVMTNQRWRLLASLLAVLPFVPPLKLWGPARPARSGLFVFSQVAFVPSKHVNGL